VASLEFILSVFVKKHWILEKPFANFFYVLFKHINKDLCNVIVFVLCCECDRLVRIKVVIEALDVVAERTRCVLLDKSRICHRVVTGLHQRASAAPPATPGAA